jgi:hypothetical protein
MTTFYSPDLMIKTYMHTYNLTSFTFQITKALLVSVRNTKAIYTKSTWKKKRSEILMKRSGGGQTFLFNRIEVG